MRIKIHSSEINRMLKTVSACIDPKNNINSNIEISHEDNILSIRAANGQFAAVMSAPMLGGDGEKFCVDGTLFAKVCGLCNGEIDITTDGKACTVKGAGRTRLPIVEAKIPHIERVKNANVITAKAEDLIRGFQNVGYAVSTDTNRIQLTGVLMEGKDGKLNMVALDGFKMSVEPVEAKADEISMIVPSAFMKLLQSGAFQGEEVTIMTDGHRIEAFTDSMLISGGLLNGQFPDYSRIMPTQFRTQCIMSVDELRTALKSCGAVNTENNLVKLDVGADSFSVMSNSERADFDADVDCMTSGDGLKIAFNHKFLMESIGAIDSDRILMKFNSPVSPCVMCGANSEGQRLLLPVRVAG